MRVPSCHVLLLGLGIWRATGVALNVSLQNGSNASDDLDISAGGIGMLDDTGVDTMISTAVTQQVVSNVNASNPGRQLLGSVEDDLTFSGEYIIYQCGYGKRGSHASQLVSLLPKIWSDLQLVVREITTAGLTSQYGAQPFFKTQSNLNYAKMVYQNMADGRSVKLDSGGDPVNPMIVCGDPGTNTPYAARCSNLGFKSIGFSPFGSNTVVLCPGFWNRLEYDVPPHSRCPASTSSIQQVHSDDLLQFSRRGVLVHELAHIYLGNSIIQDEPYAASKAIELDAADSIRTPSNFALFYSSVVAGCTSWPEYID